jgi:hypothetical protein
MKNAARPMEVALRGSVAAGLAVLVTVAFPKSASAFDFFEHQYLGEVACKVSLALGMTSITQPPTSCAFLDPRLVAVAGDHAADVGALGAASASEGLQVAVERQAEAVYAWLSQHGKSWDALQNDDVEILTTALHEKTLEKQVQSLRKALASQIWVTTENDQGAAAKLVTAAPDGAQELFQRLSRGRPDCFSPSQAVEDGFDRLDGYVDLAMKNYNHFGWAAQDEFLKHLDKARKDSDSERTNELSFAAHFLTDEYAAGHIRVERRDLAAALAKYQHDWDNRNGLSVRQSFFGAGQRFDIYWRAFGDRCLLGTEARTTRILAEFALVQSFRNVADGSEVSWTRPLAWDEGNPDVEADYTEHFNVTLELGTRVPFRREEEGASPLIRTRVGLEYLPPLFAAFMFGGSLEFDASRQIVLAPVGFGFHGFRFVTMLEGAVRWSSDSQYLEIGPELEAGYAFEIFQPIEMRATAVAASFFHQGSAHGVTVDYDLEAFAAIVYRFDR